MLVRHGEAYCNADQFIGGHEKCTGLTERGVRQVEALRDRWKSTGELSDVAMLYASNLLRAKETARILAEALEGLDVVEDCDFCEFHIGEEADGLSWADFETRYPRTFQFREDPFASPFEGPGWESIEEFRFRVGRALHRVAREHAGRTVVIACHGGIVDVSMSVFLGLPVARDARPVDLVTNNASITEWTRPVGDGDVGRWRLVRYNDAAHCAELT